MLYHTFGQWLKWRREGLSLTQKTLAQRVGCSEIMIRKLEIDARRPSLNIAQLLAEHLGVPSEHREQFVTFARSGQPNFAPFAYWTSTRQLLTNLAVQPTRLIGRDKQITSLCDKFRHEGIRLLTLVGPPGIGKTRLSIEVAWRLIDYFEDGVYFIALDSIDSADLVTSVMLGALGLSFNKNQPPLETIRRYLRERHVLLVLDNFEHVLPAASQISEILGACPFVQILTTSRATLRLREERHYPVPPLVAPQKLPSEDTLLNYSAVALFVERAQTADPDFKLSPENCTAVLDICSRLDGLPLAIELIAAYIKVLSPQQLLPLLTGHFLLSSNTQSGLTSRRHQTLGTAIESSYQLLSPPLRHLFAQLSVFVGGWTLQSAQAVCEFGGQDILTDHMALLDRSLIQQEKLPNGERRFKMLVPVREYAMQRLEADGLTHRMRNLHSLYFCEMADVNTETQWTGYGLLDWLERLDAEYANIHAALDWCESNLSRLETLLRLISGLEWYWMLRGRLQEGYQRSQRILSLAPPENNLQMRWARALCAVARLATHYGDFTKAAALVDEPYHLYVWLGNDMGAAYSLLTIGFIKWISGNFEGAESEWQQSLRLATQLTDTPLLAVTYFFLGNYYLSTVPRRNLVLARQTIEQSLHYGRLLDNPFLMTMSLMVLAHIQLLEGNLSPARASFMECVTFSQMLQDTRETATAMNGVGRIELLEGNPHSAFSLYLENLKTFQEINYKSGVIDALFGIAETFLARNQLEQAAKLFAVVEHNLDSSLIVPIDRAHFHRCVAKVRQHLDKATYIRCQSIGQSLHWEMIDPKMIQHL